MDLPAKSTGLLSFLENETGWCLHENFCWHLNECWGKYMFWIFLLGKCHSSIFTKCFQSKPGCVGRLWAQLLNADGQKRALKKVLAILSLISPWDESFTWVRTEGPERIKLLVTPLCCFCSSSFLHRRGDMLWHSADEMAPSFSRFETIFFSPSQENSWYNLQINTWHYS